MRYVPTHGLDCAKLSSYPADCDRCGAKIIYFACSCGSKVYFDPYDEGDEGDGGVHDCANSLNLDLRSKRALLLGYLIELAQSDPSKTTHCPMCDKDIKNKKDNIRKHFKKCPNRRDWFPEDF